MRIFPNQTLEQLNSFDHPVFQYVEKRFDDWIENSNPASENDEKYFGEDAIYTKRGAIEQALENLIDEAQETGKPVDVTKFDLECAFE